MRALQLFIAGLSRRGCARASGGIGRIAYALDGRGRGIAMENLDCVYGDALSAKEKGAIARASYELFVRTMGDLFWSTRLRPDNVARWISIEGHGHLADDRRGRIVVIPHLAGFEWVPISSGLLGRSGIGVAEPFKNPRIAPIFDRLRSIGGNVVHGQKGVALRFYRHLKNGGHAGLLVDLSLPPGDASTIIESFGMLRSVPALAAALHLRTDAPLVYAEPEVFPDGKMRVVFHPPVEFPPDTPVARVTQATWAFYERIIRERPGHWMWAYKYWRHLPDGAARRYPAYAKASRRFDKTLARQLAEARPRGPVPG